MSGLRKLLEESFPGQRMKTFFRSTEGGMFLILIMIGVLLALLTPKFANAYNLGITAREFSFTAIIAMGETIVLISGGIDLSVGAMAGLGGVLTCWLMVHSGMDGYVCILLGILIGAFLGGVNGVFITKLKLNPFMVTLATGEIFSGTVMVITKGFPITGIPSKVLFLGEGMLGSIPIPVVIMVVLAVIYAYILQNVPLGRYVYAVGGNEPASRVVGINIDRVKIMVYAMSGLLASFSGILFAMRVSTAQPTAGDQWLMPAITAAIIGGTSLMGGEGKVWGTIIGAAIMGILINAIILLNISEYWQNVITGAAVLIAISVDRFRVNLNRS